MTNVTIHLRASQFSFSVLKCLRKDQHDRLLEPIHRQVLRSATSIGANIIEAQHCSTTKTLTQYLQIAYRSSKETEYWLQLLKETSLSLRTAYASLLDENIQMSKILSTILIRTKKNASSSK